MPLKKRRAGGYVKRFGPSVELRLLREIHPPSGYSEKEYDFYLKACEALDIARKKTYIEHGGLNKISPLIQALGHPMLEIELGRIGGTVQGRRNRESGQLRKISSMGGRITGPILGRRNVENGQLAKIQSKGGAESGRRNVENGHLANLRTTSHQQKAGKAAGRIAVERGQVQTLNHFRWHIHRNIVNPKCQLCIKLLKNNA